MADPLMAHDLCSLSHLWTMEFEITLLCPYHLHNVCLDTVFKKEAIGGNSQEHRLPSQIAWVQILTVAFTDFLLICSESTLTLFNMEK